MLWFVRTVSVKANVNCVCKTDLQVSSRNVLIICDICLMPNLCKIKKNCKYETNVICM